MCTGTHAKLEPDTEIEKKTKGSISIKIREKWNMRIIATTIHYYIGVEAGASATRQEKKGV